MAHTPGKHKKPWRQKILAKDIKYAVMLKSDSHYED
ncbi:unnamed protein product [Lasius platythorax]|uniref:Uncharacterized protein n=1 Tax=Lasius platythorax TaxID=488582 RepID=A0AAV2N6H1_9HYME